MTERFTLISELGRGGMGVVWKARDRENGQIVALKLLRETYAEDPEYLARFERELELARRIDSAHVVKVLGFGVRKKVPYLALEYIEGPSLYDALTAHGPYIWPETRAILAQLAQGLADANAAGVIHRDVKPSNVLIAPDGTAKLTDFGIARGLDLTRFTATSTILGTPAYLAPEGPKDARSDLYSLGVIGYELLTGAVPFKGTSYQEVIVEHIRTAPDLEKLPPDARPIIGWLLAKNPDDRPQRASLLLPVLYGAATVPIAQPTELASAAMLAPMAGTTTAQPALTRQAAPSPGALPAPSQPLETPTRTARGPVPGAVTAVPRLRTPRPLIASLGLICLAGFIVAAALATGPLSSAARPTDAQPPAANLTSVTPTMTPTPRLTVNPTKINGTFSVTGSMSTPRVGHTATLLADGRVLIAGASGSAELYDPKTGSFRATGSMRSGRFSHTSLAEFTATLLPDGRVLVVGGTYDRSAELYDPKTETFSLTGSMKDARLNGETATLLSDGRVLIVGGGASGVYASDIGDLAEVYDPSTGSFSATGSMSTRRGHQTATMLADGRVLVVGGSDGSTYLNSAELYDPKNGTFSPTGSMADGRIYHTATMLAEGRVVIIGGLGITGQPLVSAELYDPKTGSFGRTGSMSEPRQDYALSLLSDGRVLVAGGWGSGYLASAEVYDPKTGAFHETGSMIAARNGPTATLLSDGRVLVLGGENGQGPLLTAEVYTP
jgi:hypothetical protein